MPRRLRQCPPGCLYHVLNRGVGRVQRLITQREREAGRENPMYRPGDWSGRGR